MYKKISIKIALILVTAAFLIVPSSVLQVSYAQTNQDMQTVLNVHNSERAAVKVPPLTWSNSLADGAQTWATHLATTGQFAHDPVYTGLSCFQARTNPCYGENIAGFNPSKGPSAPGEGVDLWVKEKSKYTPGSPVDLYVNGHYTQMVWQATTKVGCATAPPNGQAPPNGHPYSILVCRYDPSGNGPPGVPYGADSSTKPSCG